eukprot:scaffold35478_cov129-Isochrysis_galbana.AAC.3
MSESRGCEGSRDADRKRAGLDRAQTHLRIADVAPPEPALRGSLRRLHCECGGSAAGPHVAVAEASRGLPQHERRAKVGQLGVPADGVPQDIVGLDIPAEDDLSKPVAQVRLGNRLPVVDGLCEGGPRDKLHHKEDLRWAGGLRAGITLVLRSPNVGPTLAQRWSCARPTETEPRTQARSTSPSRHSELYALGPAAAGAQPLWDTAAGGWVEMPPPAAASGHFCC